jgi:3-deoxy-D-manno-octulosonate 8-phosphate phosphatase (KDO 8-P phosphatase)
MNSPAIEKKASLVKCLIMDIDGIFTNGQVHMNAEGQEVFKSFHTQDSIGLRQCQSLGIKLAVISGRRSNIVYHRLLSLHKMDRVYLGYLDKFPIYQSICQQFDLESENIAYIGDDLSDLPCIQAAGLGVTVPNAVDCVLKAADWVTQQQGGCAAVRNLCDLIYHSQAAS